MGTCRLTFHYYFYLFIYFLQLVDFLRKIPFIPSFFEKFTL